MRPLITNIQRFSLHDGPGIRTTVFFKGCSLHCPWCANPENICSNEEFYFISEKCNPRCNKIADCVQKKYPQECPYGAIGKWGKFYSEEELYSILIRDKVYYGKDGGVTFSGGEPLLFLNNYENVLAKLKADSINIVVETALNVNEESVIKAASYVDRFYVDIKSLDEKLVKTVIGGDLGRFKENVSKLRQVKGMENIVFRIPIVSNFSDSAEAVQALTEYLTQIDARNIEIFALHNLAEKKYERLGRNFQPFEAVSNEKLTEIREQLSNKSSRNVAINSLAF